MDKPIKINQDKLVNIMLALGDAYTYHRLKDEMNCANRMDKSVIYGPLTLELKRQLNIGMKALGMPSIAKDSIQLTMDGK